MLATPNPSTHQLRFESLHREGLSLCFPCNEQGNVDIDALPQRARNNYLAARALLGRDYAYPTVLATH
jgi:hypothetical protein